MFVFEYTTSKDLRCPYIQVLAELFIYVTTLVCNNVFYSIIKNKKFLYSTMKDIFTVEDTFQHY